MILGRIGEVASDGFSVTNENSELVPGIDSTAFTIHLFNPSNNEVSSTSSVSINECGYGHYRINFIPNATGVWLLFVYHSTYFPWGKSESFQVFSNDFDTIAVNLARALGLMQENYFMDENVYNDDGNLLSARMRLYNDKNSVGTDSNVLATYTITAEWNGIQMESYKVVKE